jgi:AcrR family transcriptional regulator
MTTATRDTRQTIITGAVELFRKQGFAATTMQQVAEVTGISKGNLTYHFPSKQALFEDVHALMTAYVKERVIARSFAESPDTLSGLEAFTARLRRWMIDEDGHFVGCPFTNIAVETQRSDPAIAGLNRQTLVELKALLAEQLAAGQSRGEVRQDHEATALSHAFFWMYEGALALSRAMDDPSEYDEFRAHLRTWLAP